MSNAADDALGQYPFLSQRAPLKPATFKALDESGSHEKLVDTSSMRSRRTSGADAAAVEKMGLEKENVSDPLQESEQSTAVDTERQSLSSTKRPLQKSKSSLWTWKWLRIWRRSRSTSTDSFTPNDPPAKPIKKKSNDDPVGDVLEVKRIDEVYDDKKGNWHFRDTDKSIAESSGKGSAYAKYAFTVTRKFNETDDKDRHDIVTTIDIHSQELRNVGKEVMKDAQNISWTVNPLKADPDFLLAYLPKMKDHLADLRWKLKKDKGPSDTNLAKTVKHLKFLTEFLQQEYRDTLDTIASLTKHGEITFELLFAILVPGSLIISCANITSEPRLYRLRSAQQKNSQLGTLYWKLKCEYVEACDADDEDTSGSLFGLANSTLEIPYFSGESKICLLPAFPLQWHSEEPAIRERLESRGRKWAALHGTHHRQYNAVAYRMRLEDYRHVKIRINSRIMVDRKLFIQMNPNYSLMAVVRSLSGDPLDKMRSKALAMEMADKNSKLDGDNLLLTPPIIYGFSLADKYWLEFNIEHVSTFEWNDEAFANLVLPPEQKKLITSLVKSHTQGDVNFDDFIEGKGKGLVLNLFGSPGVGKSLTAEATSEHVQKPLYVVGAGDLGTNASSLDRTLTQIFDISSAWGAVVLIDEADVFLEERSLFNLERNAMVAVFLRHLEYFRGILFLTTNRVKTFDEAFQSRIHVSMRYQDLTADAKSQIWTAFLKKADVPTDAISSRQLEMLADKKINGRQIKNVVKTAAALANNEGEVLSFRHLTTVIDMMEHFDSNAMYS